MAAVLAIGAPASTAAAHASTKFVSITRTAFVPSAVAITTGEYSIAVAPTIQTVYTVEWHNATSKANSAPVTVNVRPVVGLGLVSHRGIHFTYRAKVTSDISYAGHFVYFQRYSAAAGGWVSLKRVFLGSASRATFAVTLRPRLSKVRVFLSAGQAGNGYTWGVSRSLLAIH